MPPIACCIHTRKLSLFLQSFWGVAPSGHIHCLCREQQLCSWCLHYTGKLFFQSCWWRVAPFDHIHCICSGQSSVQSVSVRSSSWHSHNKVPACSYRVPACIIMATFIVYLFCSVWSSSYMELLLLVRWVRSLTSLVGLRWSTIAASPGFPPYSLRGHTPCFCRKRSPMITFHDLLISLKKS